MLTRTPKLLVNYISIVHTDIANKMCDIHNLIKYIEIKRKYEIHRALTMRKDTAAPLSQ